MPKLRKGCIALSQTHPELCQEWDYEKNAPLTPDDVTDGSNKTVWWKCDKGHEWRSMVNNRANKHSKCPYCSGRYAIIGETDLATVRPDLVTEWNWEKNGLLKPSDITAHSKKKVWWKCNKGHEWEIDVGNRTHGNGCPYCSGRKVLVGFNDLATANPDIAEEWHPTKNQISPIDVTLYSNIKVWWLGKCGHEWEAKISNRTKLGRGCPICFKELQTSFSEQAIFYYLHKYYPDTINGDTETIGRELDIYIPSLKTAIEYDGSKWHHSDKKKNTDIKKNEECIKHNIRLIRVQEHYEQYNPDKYDNCICITRNDLSYDSLTKCIIQIFKVINNTLSIDININRDEQIIQSQYIKLRKERSLASLFPDIAKEWHPTKNGNLTPEMVTPMSNKNVWWLGKCGHEWKVSIDKRINSTGCPYCWNKSLCKSIICVETGKIYKSISDAHRDTGIGISTISRCCLGKYKIAGGYHWKYVDQ